MPGFHAVWPFLICSDLLHAGKMPPWHLTWHTEEQQAGVGSQDPQTQLLLSCSDFYLFLLSLKVVVTPALGVFLLCKPSQQDLGSENS